jgi:hypothetical protein
LYIGGSVGVNKNYFYTNISNLSFTAIQSRFGFSAGIPVLDRVNNWLSVISGIQYEQKNYEMLRTGYFQGIYQKVTNSYIQVPIKGHFSFGGKKLKGFAEAGGYIAYWAAGKVKGVEASGLNPVVLGTSNQTFLQLSSPYAYNQAYQFNSIKDRRLELGWMAGAGISFELKNKLLFAGGSFFNSITDQQKNYMINQVPRYNLTYNFSAGCLINISHFHK